MQPPSMQPPPKGVAIHMQPYPDGQEELGGSKPWGARLGPQILHVRDHVLWSLFNFAFWNFCCLGFAAVILSVKSRDCKVVGDVEGASYYGKKARWLNIIIMLLSIVVFAIFITLIANGNLPALLRDMYGPQSPTPPPPPPPPDWTSYNGK